MTDRSDPSLNQQKVTVLNHNGTVVYYKVRELYEDEIIQFVKSPRDDAVLWTIHTPTRRDLWYLNIRSPPNGPAVEDEDAPRPQNLLVSLRSRRVQRDTFFFTIPASLENSSPVDGPGPVGKPQVITYIIYKQNHMFRSDSFSIVRAADAAGTHSRSSSSSAPSSPLPPLSSPPPPPAVANLAPSPDGPILTFMPSNVLNLNKKGELNISFDQCAKSGLSVDFWVSVALAYIEFLEDKDAYIGSKE